MHTLIRKLWLVPVCSALLLPTLATAAQGVTLSCGDTITQSTVLQNDVGPCTNSGIIVGANGITFDLNGHRIFGSPDPGDGFGVYLLGRTGVTVKNGTVSSFDGGVVIEGGSGNTVREISAESNISFETVPRRAGDGISIESSRNNRILNNSAVNNGPYSGIGLYTQPDSEHPRSTTGVASGNLIQNNTVANNIQARSPNNVVNNDNIGIRLEPGSSGNFIIGNQVSGNGLDGITMFVRASRNLIRGNQVTRNGFYRVAARRGNGIGMQIGGANDNVVEGNYVTQNADNGISIRNGSMRNTVRNNVAVNNAVLPPASTSFGPTFDLLDNNANCDSNVWTNNRYTTAFPACAGG